MSDYIRNKAKADLELDAIERAEAADQSGKRQVWERMPRETARAYGAFVRFRDLAEKRSFVRVAELLGCTPQNVERWARRWNWLNRCYEHDLVQEERFREQTARDRVAHHRRQIQIGQAVQSVAVAGLREWQARLEQGLPLNLAPEQLAVLLKFGDQLESSGLGEDKAGAGRYTRIIVNFGVEEAPPDASEARPAALSDGTTGEEIEADHRRTFKKPN
ncbi:MAG: hypothetical protein WAM04_09930 [Candidatus Sulfotelmatobacter sp.]